MKTAFPETDGCCCWPPNADFGCGGTVGCGLVKTDLPRNGEIFELVVKLVVERQTEFDVEKFGRLASGDRRGFSRSKQF